MRRRVAVGAGALVLLAAGAGTGGAVESTSALSSVRPGAVFNNPLGGRGASLRVVRHVNQAIAAAPAGSTIRIATYSLRLRSTAERLEDAARRGVRVRMVLNGDTNQPGPLISGLRRAGATVVRTRGTARTSGSGNMHVKLYLFSRSGMSREVAMVGSANLATGNLGEMWTDLYTSVGAAGLYDELVRLHRELMRDQPVDPPYRVVTIGPHQLTVFPHPGTGPETDDVVVALRGTDPEGAVVRASVYTWQDARGQDIARELARLRTEGADVAVIHNGISSEVRRILDQAGVPTHDSRLDVDRDGVKDYYVHHKYFLVGHPGLERWRTYTGSHNWNVGSLRRADELMLRIDGRATFEDYLANFQEVRRAG